MSWDEFQNISLAELEALEERREIGVRHARFNAALVASAILNANRSPDTPSISPFDFLAGFERTPEELEREEERRAIKNAVALAFVEMRGASRAEVLAEKDRMLERMRSSGVEDPEGIIREVYPELAEG